jgi:serine/threonine protein kinase
MRPPIAIMSFMEQMGSSSFPRTEADPAMPLDASSGGEIDVSLLRLRALLAGRYRVERELGRGGMATVYLAEEAKHGRKVAIKVLHPEVAPALGAERFLREIGIAARLSHPHLVPLIDSGQAGSFLYYVSAYIDGGSLRDRLQRERRLSLDDALRIAQEAGAGLDYAHRAGFIHRDVKPENILFADGHALLADFGIARACCEVNEKMAGLVTTAGIAVGTPDYMSPEQAAGETTIDARSDVYALACVVFEMLAGEAPFAGTSPRATMARHVAETPRPVRTLRPDTPPALEAVLARALAKDPAQRYGSVADLVDALRAAQAAAPAPLRVAAAVRGMAVLPFINASPDAENEYLSDGITDELIDALAKVGGIRVASRSSVFALKGKPQDARSVGALLNCDTVLEGTVRRSGDRLRITAQLVSTADGSLLWSQRYDRRLDDAFAIQDEIARTIVNTLRAAGLVGEWAEATPRKRPASQRAYLLYLKGRYEWNRRTQEGLVAAIRFFEEAIEEDPTYALPWTGLADAHAIEVDYRSIPVAKGFEVAKECARRAIELDDSLAEAHTSLAWCLFIHDWDWAGAEQEFRRAIDLDPRYAVAHQWYAFQLASRAAFGEALVEGHTAVELDQGSVSARRSLGWQYYYARRWDQARYHLERAIAMDPTAEESWRVLGLVHALEGNVEEAVRVLREAVDMPGSGTYTRATLGYALARAGDAEGARANLLDLQRIAETGYVSPVAFSTIHLGLGEVERALDWAEQAWRDRRGWLAYLGVNPLMDPMRGHPRFDALVERMRF